MFCPVEELDGVLPSRTRTPVAYRETARGRRRTRRAPSFENSRRCWGRRSWAAFVEELDGLLPSRIRLICGRFRCRESLALTPHDYVATPSLHGRCPSGIWRLNAVTAR